MSVGDNPELVASGIGTTKKDAKKAAADNLLKMCGIDQSKIRESENEVKKVISFCHKSFSIMKGSLIELSEVIDLDFQRQQLSLPCSHFVMLKGCTDLPKSYENLCCRLAEILSLPTKI